MVHMEKTRELVWSRSVESDDETYLLFLYREDFSAVFPHMIRYTLLLQDKNEIIAVFRTNNYEYSPTVPLDAESSAHRVAEEWAESLRKDPIAFLESRKVHLPPASTLLPSTVVVIQGSPRSDGNSSIMAQWVSDAAREAGETVSVIFPDDLEIHHCIGCYRCFNTGSCTFEDDMGDVISAIQHSSLLVVCSPVYTNTVPGSLKILIDRCQAYQAAIVLVGRLKGPRGLILGVCGRSGKDNFRCLVPVLEAFMENVGIKVASHLLVDDVDESRDIASIQGLREEVRGEVFDLLDKR
jgi:multimeric flavodoxin WrbA